MCQVLDQLHVWTASDATRQDLARVGLRVLLAAVNQPVEEVSQLLKWITLVVRHTVCM